MDLQGRISDDTLARLRAAAAGEGVARHLRIADLEVGDFGVIQANVAQVHPPRTFQRKRGGEGMVGRVTLSDASGEVDLVLWDDELGLTRDGPLRPGACIVLRGATVKAGWKGGIELGLGSAVLEDAGAEPAQTLRGRLVSVGPTEVVDGHDGPRFKAEATIEADEGEVMVIAWGDAVRALQVAPGTEVTLEGVPHPALDACWIAGSPA